MQKIRVVLLMVAMCVSSFFVQVVKGEENTKFNVSRTHVAQQADDIYNQIDFGKEDPLSREVFRKAYTGYLNLKDAGKLNPGEAMLSICDFSLSSNVKRLWVIDLDTRKIMFHTLVAHGQGTGDEFAVNFSNRENSHQSSFGFFVTRDTYMGDNGYSLRLDGMDEGYNDAALSRAIVIHGADYVCDAYVRSNKRLGRSWGCPAIPAMQSKAIINAIKDKTCFYIYFPNRNYLAHSVWLNKVPAATDEDLIKDEFMKLNKAGAAPPAAPATPSNLIASDSGKDKTVSKVEEGLLYQGVKLAVGR